MTDAFGREIKASIDDLKTALLKDVGQTAQSTKSEDKNTDQLKNLNDKIDDILGGQFHRELKALAKLIERVAQCCETINKTKGQRSTRELNKEATVYAKAVARALGPRGGGDISSEFKKIFKEAKPVFQDVTDKAMNFGLVLERSQRRFGVAFKMVGKQFQKDFAGITNFIRDKFNKFNPFKAFEKEGEKSASRSWFNIKKMWGDVTGGFKASWNELVSDFKSSWHETFGGISKWWTDLWGGVINGVKDKWDAVAKKVSESWLGKAYGAVTNKLGQYFGPIGRAMKGTVKDLFKMGQSSEVAARDIDDLTAEPTKKMMEPGGGVPGVEHTESGDLCECICHCIEKLMNLTSKGVKSQTAAKNSLQTLVKEEKKIDKAQGATDGKRVPGRPGVRTKAGGAIEEKSAKLAQEDLAAMQEKEHALRIAMMKDDARQQRGGGGGVKRATLGAVQSVGNSIYADNPLANGLNATAQFTSKATGLAVGGIPQALGAGLEKIVGPLGTPIKLFGEALGGLAEGLMTLVLHPLVEEVNNFRDEMQAMYITRGSTGAVTGGTGLSQGAQGVADFAAGINIANKKEEVFKRTVDEINETGQRLSVIQKEHIKNIRKGIREEDKWNKTSNIGLRAASQIGANAEQTADMFADWKIKLGASNVQLGEMERGMLSIARSTGVFGDNLVHAAKASQQFMEYMRMSGTFTAKAANNIIGLMAEAQKRGVSQGMENLLQLFKGSLLEEGGDEKARALAITGMGGNERVRGRMLSGTLLEDRGAQKIFAENLGKRLNDLAVQRFGKTYDRLSIEERGWLSQTTRAIFGKGAEELNQIVETFKERGKDFSDRLKDINTKGLTDMEKAVQKEQLIYDTSGEILSDFSRALKEEGGDVEKAFAKIKKSSEDLGPLLGQLGLGGAKGGGAVEGILRAQLDQLTKRATREGLTAEVSGAGFGNKGDIDKAIKDAMDGLAKGDRKNFDDLQAKMTALEGKTREQMRQNSDPATKMLMLMFKMEGYLRIMARQAITELSPLASGGAAAMDKVLDEAAKEFAKNTPEGRENAIKMVADAIKNLPMEITKMNKEVQGIPGATNLQRGGTALMDVLGGTGSPLGAMTKLIGDFLKENADKIAGALTDLTGKIAEAIKIVNDNMDTFKTALMVVAGVFVGGGLIMGINALVSGFGGISAALAGPGGLVVAAGGAAYSIYKLTERIMAIPGMKAENAATTKNVKAGSAQSQAQAAASLPIEKDAVKKLTADDIEKGIAFQKDVIQKYQDQAAKILERQNNRSFLGKRADEALGRTEQWNAEIEAIGKELDIENQRLQIYEAQKKKLLEGTAAPATGQTPTVTPALPNKDAETEMRKKKAESQGTADMSKTETATAATAANTAAIVRLLARIAASARRGANGPGVEAPDFPLTPFFNNALNVDWSLATIGRALGLEFQQ